MDILIVEDENKPKAKNFLKYFRENQINKLLGEVT
jgi:hypothetical protein